MAGIVDLAEKGRKPDWLKDLDWLKDFPELMLLADSAIQKMKAAGLSLTLHIEVKP